MSKEKLFNKGIIAVVGAQFFSALADNVLIFAFLELLRMEKYPTYSTYMLQGTFIVFYILLAPVVGLIADQYPKGRVLMVGNFIKLIGVSAFFLGVNPFLCYGIVGCGAAVYSPAKFGILGELVSNKLLVKANGMVEGSTIFAILMGAYIGGTVANKKVLYAIILTAVIYGLAVISNLFVPKIVPKKNEIKLKFKEILATFGLTLKQLFNDDKARFAIIGTSLFWGAATTLRLLLNDWVPETLGDANATEKVAMLNAIVGVGVIIGAAVASFTVGIKDARKCLFAGMGMGVVTIIFTLQSNELLISPLLIAVGACGGFFIVPLNALLQEQGQKIAGTGKAVAAQNFSENLVMLGMMVFFGLCSLAGFSALILMISFGLLFCVCIAYLGIHSRQVDFNHIV